MITGFQMSKLQAAGDLYEARERLANVKSEVAVSLEDRLQLEKLIEQIDRMFATLVPNKREGADEK